MSYNFKRSWNKGWNLGGQLEQLFSKLSLKSRQSANADKELSRLIKQVERAHQGTEILSALLPYEAGCEVILRSCEELDLPPNNVLTESFIDLVEKYCEYEGFFGVNPYFKTPKTHEERSKIKTVLRRNLNKYHNENQVYPIFCFVFEDICKGIYSCLPKSCIRAREGTETRSNTGVVFDTHILNLIDDIYSLVHYICGVFYHEDLVDLELFDKTRNILQVNGIRTEGWDINDASNYHKVFKTPSERKDLQPDTLVSKFLYNTPFPDIFLQKLPFEIPQEVRFEHTHVLAGSGHGKTQLLQKLILNDLDTNTGFCVLDSQGDLISKLLLNNRLSNPEISDKLVLIDASDVEYPPCLNLFDLNHADKQLSLKQKEILSNNTVDLYTYIFSSLLGAELTARQGTMFVYIAKLMMEIPDSSIQTLRELMEDGEKFRPYMDKLEGSAKAFFQTQFNSPSFKQVKQQILYRLWAVLSNSVLERMFSGSENKVNLFEAMNEGKIVLINTSKQVLGKVGSEIMGKFFIALLTQSALKRSSIPEKYRKGFHIYVDEAQEYVDDMFNQLINQVRKYKCGFHLFHQNLDQLPSSVRASVLSSTSIKLTGGISSKDAKTMSSEMKLSPTELMDVRKYDRQHAEFSLYVQNLTEKAITVDVPFGLLEREHEMSLVSYEKLIQDNRERYCKPLSEIQFETTQAVIDDQIAVDSDASIGVKTTQEIIKEVQSQREETVQEIPQKKDKPEVQGKGGVKHKYLQAYVSKVANELGFKASLEEQTPNGKGFIDVVLKKEDINIACEISVTTPPDYEMKNIQKCLDAGFEHIVVLSSDGQHLKAIYNKAESFFDGSDLRKMHFLSDEAIGQYFAQFQTLEQTEPKKKIVSGWEVRVSYDKDNVEQQEAKRKAVTKIMMQAQK